MYPNQPPQNPNASPAGPPSPSGPAPQPGSQTPFQGTPAQYPVNQPYSAQPAQFVPEQRAPQAAPLPGMPQQVGPATYSADYLDQIAPGPSAPKFFSGSFTWILIALAIIFMFAVGIISLFSGKSNTAVVQQTYLRFDYFLKDLPAYHKYLKSSKLSGYDADFTAFMTDAQRNLVDPMSKNGVTVKTLDKTLKASEKSYADAMVAKLEDARLNAVLDDVYAREMAYQAQLLLQFYSTMAKSNSKSISDNAKAAIPNLAPIQKSFADFSDGS